MATGVESSVHPVAIDAAAAAIGPHVRVTPILRVPAREFADHPWLEETTLVLKLEHLQHSGSFKARGAAHFLATQPIEPSGVVAASGGNHGAAVAWAANTFGHAANIFVPTIAAPAKVERLRRFGAVVHQGGDVYHDALEASRTWQQVNDAVAIHAYDDPVVMAGAGTCSREFERQAGLLDAVLVACGGGGLAGGAASWFRNRVRVVACETDGTATYAGARAAGEPIDVAVTGLAADALGATRIGVEPWRAMMAAGVESAVVTDEQLISARQLLWERFRLIVEPAAAAPIAALVAGAWRPGRTVANAIGVILCGANTDPGAAAEPQPDEGSRS